MSIKRFILSLALICFAASTFAQKAKLAKADKFFKDYDYQQAIEAYLDILDKNDVASAKINIAECYRHVDNWADAEYWYGQVVRLPESKPVHKLYYGMALQSNGKCEQAKQWFDEYTTLVPDDLRGKLLKESCDEVIMDRLLKAGALYKVTNVAQLNTAYDDFGTSYFENGLVFSSERDRGVAIKRQHSWTGQPFLELFFAKTSLVDEETLDYKYGKPEKYSTKINSKFHDGPVTFTKDFKEIYFTRNNLIQGKIGKDDEGVIRLKVYGSKRTGDKWSDFEGLPFNSDEYSVAHPSLTADGTQLFFSSDMPGGFGGMDLYVSYLENGRWSPPVNLGPSINTEGHEVFPFIHEDGTLYFASDGHTGLGGLDIFYANSTSGNFGAPVNLGYPINTTSDDFGLILNSEKRHGYLSSNRPGGSGGDDIYSFSRSAVLAEVLVYDKLTGDPIEGATVATGYAPTPTLKTGIDGKAKIQLPLDQTFEFGGSKETYNDNSITASTKNYKPGDVIFFKIPLEHPLEYTLTGIVTDKKTGKPLSGATVVLESQCGQETQYTTTDDNGFYEFVLRPNCCYIVKVYQDGYLTKEDNFCTSADPNVTAYKRDVPLIVDVAKLKCPTDPRCPDYNPNVIDPPIKGVVLEHIYYNFDRAEIRSDATASLSKLLTYLKENPGFIVEIGSHTDSRATTKYNERLSARRAESVVNYLVRNGIERSRLRAKGYGETQHVNGCYDNVKCDERDHQANRRTEFRVVGSVNGKDVDLKSGVPQTGYDIDPCRKCPF